MSLISPAKLLDSLRAAGLHVVEVGQWRTHNRNQVGPWNPRGVMLHHTASSGSADSQVRLLRIGRSDLPGPLCQLSIGADGAVYVIGYGRANHAGTGDGDVLRAVLNEARTLPSPNDESVDGNAHFWGIEVQHPGTHGRYEDRQIDATVRTAAVLCKAHGWSSRSVIHHREWTRRKIDMSWRGDARGEVAQALRLGPATYRFGQRQEWDEMATKAEVQAALEDALAKPAVLDRIVERLLDRKLGEDALGRDYALGARLRQTHVTTTRTLEITKDLAQLAADSGLSEEDRKALAADIAARVDRVTVTVEEGT